MVKVNQASLAGGEVSPAIGARVDIDKYKSSVHFAENVYVEVHGGLTSRPGMGFVAEVKDSTLSTRIIPFAFNTEQTYILEIGNLYIRVHKDGGQVLDDAIQGTISGATAASPVVITATSHPHTNGKEVYISNVAGMTQLNNRNFRVANKTTHTYEITDLGGVSINGTGYTAYASGGTSDQVFELVTPYTTAQIFDLNFVQSADVMTFTHPDHVTKELTRTDHDVWTLTTIVFSPEQPAPTSVAAAPRTAASETEQYAVTSLNIDTLEESLVASVSISNSNSTVDNDVSWAAAANAGSYNIYRKKNGIYGFVGRAEGTAFFDENIKPDTSDTPPTARDPFDATNLYPAVVAYFQQRRMFAQSNTYPQRFWTTQTANHYNMTVSSPAKDDDAITATIASLQVNEIRHMVGLNDLIILTSGGEWKVTGIDGVLTPSGIQLTPQTYYGSTKLRPIVAGDVVLYMQPGQVVRDLAYEFSTDLYKGNDVSILAHHLFEGVTIVDWAYAPTPNSAVWCVTDLGDANILTYVREQEVFGWTHYSTRGSFKSVAAVREDDDDVMYAVIERKVGGRTVQFIEAQTTHDLTNVQDAVRVDASLSLDSPITITGYTNASTIVVTATSHGLLNGDVVDLTLIKVVDDTVTRGWSYDTDLEGSGYTVANKTTHTFELQNEAVNVNSSAFSVYHSGGEVRKALTVLSGLWHMEGETLTGLANGYVVTGLVVANGSVTLPHPASRVHLGWGYTADIETLRLATPNQQDSVTGRHKKSSRLHLDLENTMGLWTGPNRDNMREAKFGLPALWGQPVELITGMIDLTTSPSWNKEGRVVIQQRDPLPMTILSITPDFIVGGN